MAVEGFIQAAEEMGIFDYYLPFILTFAIFYGLLQKVKIFGEDKQGKRINLIIAGSVAFFVMAFTPAGITLKEFFASFFAGTTVILTAGISIALVSTVLLFAAGPTENKEQNKRKPLIAIVVISALLIITNYITSGGMEIFPGIIQIGAPGIPSGNWNDFIILAVVGLITIGMIWWVVAEPSGGTSSSSGAGTTPTG